LPSPLADDVIDDVHRLSASLGGCHGLDGIRSLIGTAWTSSPPQQTFQAEPGGPISAIGSCFDTGVGHSIRRRIHEVETSTMRLRLP
jgi:hypothetical protein